MREGSSVSFRCGSRGKACADESLIKVCNGGKVQSVIGDDFLPYLLQFFRTVLLRHFTKQS